MEMVLSTKQLLVLASELEAEHFYGIHDPFFGMTTEEIQSEYASHLNALEEKGYLTQGFDDTLQIEPEVQRMMQVCIHARKYISIDTICAGVVQPHKVLYLHDGICIGLTRDGTEATLKDVSDKDIGALALESILSVCQCLPGAGEQVCIGQEVLGAVSALPGEEACKLLTDVGCSAEMAKLLAAGLQREQNYCTIGITDLDSRTLECVSVVYDETALVQLTTDDESIDRWFVQWKTREELVDAVSAQL